jgi:glutathione S-transferase
MLANFETPSRAKMLKLWGRRSSFNVQKIMWLIGELGLEHQHIDAGGRFGGLDTSAFLAMNPHGRVPVIQDGDTTVWESHAILRYLAARHGAGHFWSGDPAVRADVDGWVDWSQPRCSRISWSACSGDSIEPPKTNETGRRSGRRWRAASGILKSWSGCSRAVHFCSETR